MRNARETNPGTPIATQPTHEGWFMISSQKLHERRRGFRYLSKDHFGWSRKISLGRKHVLDRGELVMWVILSVVALGVMTATIGGEHASSRVQTAGAR